MYPCGISSRAIVGATNAWNSPSQSRLLARCTVVCCAASHRKQTISLNATIMRLLGCISLAPVTQTIFKAAPPQLTHCSLRASSAHPTHLPPFVSRIEEMNRKNLTKIIATLIIIIWFASTRLRFNSRAQTNKGNLIDLLQMPGNGVRGDCLHISEPSLCPSAAKTHTRTRCFESVQSNLICWVLVNIHFDLCTTFRVQTITAFKERVNSQPTCTDGTSGAITIWRCHFVPSSAPPPVQRAVGLLLVRTIIIILRGTNACTKLHTVCVVYSNWPKTRASLLFIHVTALSFAILRRLLAFRHKFVKLVRRRE